MIPWNSPSNQFVGLDRAMGIIENAKEVAELVRKYNDLDLYQKILDLRDEIFALREENLALRERMKEFEKAQVIAKEIRRDGNVYRRRSSDGTESGPYCMTCWDADRKLVNVILSKDRFGTHFRCGRCHKA
jgi:hypothetical protein